MTALWDDQVVVGRTEVRRLVESLSRAHIAQYAGASGDFNSVHVDEPFARSVGRTTVIAHGMLTMGLVGTFVRSLAGTGAVRSFGGRFMSPVVPGESLDCTATVEEVVRVAGGGHGFAVRLRLDVVTADGRTVFSGNADVQGPG